MLRMTQEISSRCSMKVVVRRIAASRADLGAGCGDKVVGNSAEGTRRYTNKVKCEVWKHVVGSLV